MVRTLGNCILLYAGDTIMNGEKLKTKI